MKCYCINHPTLDHARFEGTIKLAHDFAKGLGKAAWPDVTVTEVEVQADKDGLLAALNRAPLTAPGAAVWGLTNRGGLEKVE